MPELPEVETVRRKLVPVLEGRRFEQVEITDARLTRPLDPFEVARELEGERVAVVDRRGKYLILRFESGRALLIHLRMTGAVLHGTADGDPHRRASIQLDDGTAVSYRDVRRFGTWLLLEPAEVDAYVDARVGREPLAGSYRSKHLAERLAGRRAPVKAAILDQRTVAGVGNIYADEALWRVKINGARLASSLSRKQLGELLDAATEVMTDSLGEGGTSFDSLYVNVNGESGYFERSLDAYGREGEPCRRCGAVMRREKFMNRSSFYCPRCQPKPRQPRPRVRRD
jgi:formamidopyrimidine-DNA glycosylase